jgi:hypothetical protein
MSEYTIIAQDWKVITRDGTEIGTIDNRGPNRYFATLGKEHAYAHAESMFYSREEAADWLLEQQS